MLTDILTDISNKTIKYMPGFIKNIQRIIALRQLKWYHWGILFATFFIMHIPAILNDHRITNAYVMLAHSLLEGRLSLPTHGFPYFEKINYGDLILFNGNYYLPYPPFPALLIVPFIIVKENIVINSVLICVIVSCLNIYLLYKILKQLTINERLIPWLMYGFFFGTSYWYILLTSHHVYGFAQIVATAGILLLLHELLGKKRALLLGLYLGIAFLSRQSTIFFALFTIGYLYYQLYLKDDKHDLRSLLRKVVLFLVVSGSFVILYLLYNYARFGDPFNPGYRYLVFVDVTKARAAKYGIFNVHYLLYNLYSVFVKGFNIVFTGKEVLRIHDMDLFGTSLLSASPFIVAAFKTGWNKLLRIFAWCTISLILLISLFYFGNGFEQVNAMRYTFDFFPLLFILTALGAKNLPPWLFKGMIIYAILLNILAQGIHLFYHTLR